jgi:hypothetical protein
VETFFTLHAHVPHPLLQNGKECHISKNRYNYPIKVCIRLKCKLASIFYEMNKNSKLASLEKETMYLIRAIKIERKRKREKEKKERGRRRREKERERK